MREASLYVSLKDEWLREHFAIKVPIPSRMEEAFESVDVCSNPEIAFMLHLTGKITATEETINIVRKRREGYADQLAKHIAAQIVKAMESHDLQNGYKP